MLTPSGRRGAAVQCRTLKAFVEQVMRPTVALETRKHGFPRGASRKAFEATRPFIGL